MKGDGAVMDNPTRDEGAIAPGEIVRKELDKRGWTQGDFAAVIGRSESFVSRLLNGVMAISAETAVDISTAVGETPEYWLRLDARYQLTKVERIDTRPVRESFVSREELIEALVGMVAHSCTIPPIMSYGGPVSAHRLNDMASGTCQDALEMLERLGKVRKRSEYRSWEWVKDDGAV